MEVHNTGLEKREQLKNTNYKKTKKKHNNKKKKVIMVKMELG